MLYNTSRIIFKLKCLVAGTKDKHKPESTKCRKRKGESIANEHWHKHTSDSLCVISEFLTTE